jgi:DNA polymerase-3 subunit epsilon
MRKNNLAFLDVETTGLDPERHEILEVGLVLARQTLIPGRGPQVELLEELEWKVKPEHIETAEPEALRINRYNEADWLFASSLKQVMEAVAEKTADAILIAQNVTFDWGFIERAFRRTGVESKMHYHRLDLLSMAYAKLYHNEKLTKFSLSALAEYFGLKNERAHTALADTRVTFEIYKKLLEI